jgi:hypothetical protein
MNLMDFFVPLTHTLVQTFKDVLPVLLLLVRERYKKIHEVHP